MFLPSEPGFKMIRARVLIRARRTDIMKQTPRPTATESRISIHHRPQAKYTNLSPNAGTQTNTTMSRVTSVVIRQDGQWSHLLIIVAKPIGNVPRNRDCAGFRNISFHTCGNMVYLTADIPTKTTNKASTHVSKSFSNRWDGATHQYLARKCI